MDISKEDAKESLEQIEAVHSHTRKTIAASYDSGVLMMWGIICIAAFLGTHFYRHWAWYIWMVLAGIGSTVTLVVCWNQFRTAKPTKIPASERIGWRFFWFWSLLFVYIFIWLFILRPTHGIQVNAFILTAIMFAYVVIGLWTKSYYMLWLGLAVTCTTLVGFYLIPPSYYCLWMAPTSGGAFLVTGIYLRFPWK
ncbi:MAG: hypothetical protein ACYSSO_10260 [Planctomycetota bacterium]|jgi:hypothetical protein